MKIHELLKHNKYETLYHISFKSDLEGIWKPKNPINEGIDTEPELPRISCAPTIEQCFQAIYPNISNLFEEQNRPDLKFYVYSPVLDGSEHILYPEQLTKQHIVHDAHMTDEVCILDPVFMKLVMKIKIMNTNKNSFIKYRPWDNPNRNEKDFAPTNIKYKILKTY